MVDDELGAPVEELGQRLLALRPLEHVLLLDPLPGQLASLLAELVAQTCELLLLRQQRLARLDPIVMPDNFMLAQEPSSPIAAAAATRRSSASCASTAS